MTNAFWFGSPERPLFGRLDMPDSGLARAAIVLCPPLGLERSCAARTYQVLAHELKGEGFAVLRFDYDGTGDSSGSGDEPGRVHAWSASIRAGVDLMRSCGAHSVAAVGMRLGATLVASLADDCDLDGLVLWDPCSSGRAYLREQQALRSVHLGDESPAPGSDAIGNTRSDNDHESGTIEVLGDLLSAQTVEELSQLSIESAAGDLARRVLVLVRPERKANRAMAQRLSMTHVEWGEAAGQQELVGVKPSIAQVPTTAVRTITDWLSSAITAEESAISTHHNASAVVERVDGEEIVEEIVSLGPLGLFGILTRPREPRSTATAVILNAGTNDHVGPGRLWVHMARRWAHVGLPAVRVDLSGLGDSPPRPGRDVDVMYPPGVFDDLADISKAIAPDDPTAIVLVGLCSGAYHSIEGGVAMGVKGVCVVNPVIPRDPLNQPGRSVAPQGDGPPRQAAATRKPWVRKLPAHDTLAAMAEKLPGIAWWFIDRIGVEVPPARALERVVNRGVNTYVVCSEVEGRVICRGEGGVLRRLRRTGRFRLEIVSGIDHELFQRAARNRVEPMLTKYLVDNFIVTTPHGAVAESNAS